MRGRSLALLLLVGSAIVLAVAALAQPPLGPPPEPGAVLPFARHRLDLTADQRTAIAELERETKARLAKILSAEQMKQLEEALRRGPGRPPRPEPPPEEPEVEGPARPHPFHANVKVSFTRTFMVVSSDGLPTHETGTFPNRTNPNRILKQDYRFRIPLAPKRADKPTPLPMGPIGVAVNGIPFYNPYNAQRQNAVEGPHAEVFDSCCGHPDPMGRYHYHKYPVCVHNPFKREDKPGEHSLLIGYAFDGYAIYGPKGTDGKPPTDLDECNGHSDPERGYHYHVTQRFPYILGAYRGVVDPASFDRPAGRRGPPRE